jgi:hypothetical protein
LQNVVIAFFLSLKEQSMTEIDILDMTPTAAKPEKKKPVAAPAKAKPKAKKELPGRAASSTTVQLRKLMLEIIGRHRNGIPNGALAEKLRVTPGKCLQVAQLMVKQKAIVAKKPKGTKYVTWHKA